jgi:hypothetical protein
MLLSGLRGYVGWAFLKEFEFGSFWDLGDGTIFGVMCCLFGCDFWERLITLGLSLSWE